MVCAAHKGGGLHHLAANFLKGSCPQMCHIDGFRQHHLLAELLKTGQEHPSVLGNHCLKTIVSGQRMAAFEKHSKQIRFAVGIVLFDKVIDLCTQVACACIRWIRNSDPILPRQDLADVNQPVQLLGGIVHAHAFHADLTGGIRRCHKAAQQIPVIVFDIQDRAVLLGIGQGVQQTFQLMFSGVLLAIVHPCAEIVQVRTVDAVTLLNGIDMAGVLAV